ncbi:MAG: hypothetical protein Q4B52_07370 [Tissierellia bacterium]|nr:hypothetical protein [Tissierellia bacterium]
MKGEYLLNLIYLLLLIAIIVVFIVMNFHSKLHVIVGILMILALSLNYSQIKKRLNRK